MNTRTDTAIDSQNGKMMSVIQIVAEKCKGEIQVGMICLPVAMIAPYPASLAVEAEGRS